MGNEKHLCRLERSTVIKGVACCVVEGLEATFRQKIQTEEL